MKRMELGDRTLDIGETLTQTNITAPIPKAKLTPQGIKRLLFPSVDPYYLKDYFKSMFAALDLNDNMEWVVTPNFGEKFDQATNDVIKFAQEATADVWMKFNETLVKVKPTDCGEDVYRKWMALRGQST